MTDIQEQIDSDARAIEHCRQNADSYLAMFYPAAGEDLSVAEAMLGEVGTVFYRKSIRLHGDGPYNLIRQVYPCEKWLGGHQSGYKGAYRKASGCFPKWEGAVTVFLFEAPSLEEVAQLKKRIRRVYQTGNHSIHTSDTQEECVHLVQIFFNDNSVWALNNIRFKPYPQFYRSLGRYLNEEVESRSSCLGVNSLLALAGLKEAPQIDACRNERVCSDPTQHFYFNGAKVIMPDAALDGASEIDQETKGLLKALADGGVEDKAHERKRRYYQGFYSWALKTRRVLRVDEPRRLLRTLRKRCKPSGSR